MEIVNGVAPVNEKAEAVGPKEFVAPTCADDFVVEKWIDRVVGKDENTGEDITEKSFEGVPVETIEHIYPNGKKVVFVLLSSGEIATIRQGNGQDMREATIEAGKDNSALLSSMMAKCVKIGERQINMFEADKLPMKDYMTLQGEFSKLNF